MQQTSSVSQRSSPSFSTTPQPDNEMTTLLEQYHQIWSTIDQQEAAQLNTHSSNDQECAKTQVLLSEIFSPNDIVMCIAKVSLGVMADITEIETTASQEEIIAEKIVKSYTHNQVQLCSVKAHTRTHQQEQNNFMNLIGDNGTMQSGSIGRRPHAQSMNQVLPQDHFTNHRSQFKMSSPQLQPTAIKTKFGSAGPDDVRSLLYDSSDSDEIESLVFGNAANENEDKEAAQDATASDSGSSRDEAWPQRAADKSSSFAKAFGCDMTLFQLELATMSGAPKTVKYNRLRAFTNKD